VLHAWMGRCRGREFPRGRGGAALRVRRGGTHRFPAHDAARAFSLAALQRDPSTDALPVRRARSRVLLPALPAHPGPWLFGHGSRRRLRALYPGGRTVVAWIRVARKQNRHAGFALLGSGAGSYWITLASMTVLGIGMGLAVAPLTTTVINAVPPHRTGVASGINNAVASVGGLLLIAILGSVALVAFDHALDRNLSVAHASVTVRALVDSARGGLVVPQMAASLPA